LFIYIGGCDEASAAPPTGPPRQEPIPMSDSAGNPAADEQSESPCCAAIAELQRQARQRAEQRLLADGDEASPTAPPEPARDA
jgi:hypothetical protein